MKEEYKVLAVRVVNRDGSKHRIDFEEPKLVNNLDDYREELKQEFEYARFIYIEYESKE